MDTRTFRQNLFKFEIAKLRNRINQSNLLLNFKEIFLAAAPHEPISLICIRLVYKVVTRTAIQIPPKDEKIANLQRIFRTTQKNNLTQQYHLGIYQKLPPTSPI